MFHAKFTTFGGSCGIVGGVGGGGAGSSIASSTVTVFGKRGSSGKVLTGEFDPIPHAQIVTTTTHKTLRGPRGGLVLCNQELKDHVDRGCPLVLGGPLPHVMAAKTVAFTEALRPDFRTYAHRIVENAKALGEAFVRQGLQRQP